MPERITDILGITSRYCRYCGKEISGKYVQVDRGPVKDAAVFHPTCYEMYEDESIELTPDDSVNCEECGRDLPIQSIQCNICGALLCCERCSNEHNHYQH